ncbi:MAG: shikimate dehydrogenase [Gemmatimonadales bacterium]|nr:MAG: shikimate dehydrogenase [Gemmatimonadales bacterium]
MTGRSPITSTTRTLALLGDPVGHSLSPAIQNAAMEAAGLDGVYVALRAVEGDLAGLMRGLAAAGGGGNVTLPHKERAAAAVDRPTEAVRRTGACNTFWYEDGEIHGDNTDVEGLRRAVHAHLQDSLDGARVLILGAGGAARAALAAVLDDGAAEVEIHNRTVERARAVARRLGGSRTRVIETRVDLKGRSYDLVLNATRLGLHPEDPLPLGPEHEVNTPALLDLVYTPGETEWVRQARAAGIHAMDGGEMLVQQGAVAFERWWGIPGPAHVMRAELDRLRRSGV